MRRRRNKSPGIGGEDSAAEDVMEEAAEEIRRENSLEDVEEGKKMNFYDKKFRKIISIVILVVIAAMVLTMVLPYIV